MPKKQHLRSFAEITDGIYVLMLMYDRFDGFEAPEGLFPSLESAVEHVKSSCDPDRWEYAAVYHYPAPGGPRGVDPAWIEVTTLHAVKGRWKFLRR